MPRNDTDSWDPTFTDVLAADSVNSTVPQPDGSTIVFAEDCGPAPNAVEVFADHTAREVVELECGAANERAYRVGPAGGG